ncbi:MAG: prephenate dehydratase [Planctomycetota bacterium]
MSHQTPRTDAPRTLSELRTLIDDVDGRLVALLAERANLVVEVGHAKRHENVPIYAPSRERAVIERAVSRNPGPLGARTIEAVFREIMSGSFALERPLRVACLGPEGSFSHMATARHFGASVESAFVPSIEDVVIEVAAGRSDHGLVPYENSSAGSIHETLDALIAHPVSIRAETMVAVRLALLANCAPADIRRVYSKPQAFAQCRQWCARVIPQAELVPESSTSAAVLRARGEQGAAAVASSFAGELHGVRTLFDGIEDRAGNTTRFLVIGREPVPPTGSDKTTMWFALSDRAGALVDVLDAFRREGINLSHIEKRPSGDAHWDYVFFIDALAHEADAPMQRALAEARRHCAKLSVLGSYPRAERVL